MTELSDNPELQMYTSAVLYVLSAVNPPKEYIVSILDTFILAIKSSQVSYGVLFRFGQLYVDKTLRTFTVMEDQAECFAHPNRVLLQELDQLL
jgi:hypothetical protein